MPSLSFRRRPESTPAWMQVVERRREQAAEEARPENEGMAGSYRMAHWIGVPVIVIPAVREWVI